MFDELSVAQPPCAPITKPIALGSSFVEAYSRRWLGRDALLLFGPLGGALKTGRWVVTPMVNVMQAEGQHMNKLFVSILNALGIPDQTFGDPSANQGPLTGVFG